MILAKATEASTQHNILRALGAATKWVNRNRSSSYKERNAPAGKVSHATATPPAV